MSASRHATAALRATLDRPHLQPNLVDGTSGPTALWVIDNAVARGVAGAFPCDLELEDFRIGAYAGALRLDGTGAPPSLRAALPSRWAGIGRVELWLKRGWMIGLAWGWDSTERERVCRYTASLVGAAHAWTTRAPRLWTRGPAPRAALTILEDELSWLAPHVVESAHGLRARLLLDEGDGYEGELQLDAEALTLEGGLPAGAPAFQLEREGGGLAGWWARRNELILDDEALDDAWLVDAPEEAAAVLRALGPGLLALHAREGQVLCADARLRLSSRLGDDLRGGLKNAAGLWRALALDALGLVPRPSS